MLSEAKHLLLLEHIGENQILRGACPEAGQEKQILRFAQDDSEGLRMTSQNSFSTNF